jgi:hypothetical protein
MIILLRDFSAKIDREDIFKPIIWNESVHKTSIDSGIKVVYFATSKNLTVKSTVFRHHNFHKFTWMSSDGRTHILIAIQ